jgi:hypothetical protein
MCSRRGYGNFGAKYVLYTISLVVEDSGSDGPPKLKSAIDIDPHRQKFVERGLEFPSSLGSLFGHNDPKAQKKSIPKVSYILAIHQCLSSMFGVIAK